MRRAAVRGAIDFASADLLSPLFWRRLGQTMRVLLEEELLDLERLDFQWSLALYQATASLGERVEAEALTNAGKVMERTLTAIQDRIQPWYRKQRAETIAQELRGLESEWAAFWGDPSDPDVRRKIEEASRALRGK